MFMELEGIYILNTIAQLVLSIAVLYFMYKRLGVYSIAYVVFMLCMHPENIVQSFQLSSTNYALQIAMLLLLLKKEWKERHVLYIFLLDGILVAFFDFLTYPYVVVAIPLLTYYWLNNKSNIVTDLITMIKNGMSFIFGYVGMWAMKWILATIFTDENVIMDAIKSVLHRTGVAEGTADVMTPGVGESLYRNMYTFFDNGNITICLVDCIK